MNRFELILGTLRLPIDILGIALAGVIAYYLRTSEWIRDIQPIFYQLSFDNYLHLVLIFGILVIIVSALSGLYTMKITRGPLKESHQVITAVSTATLLVILYHFFYARELLSSRFLIMALWFFTIILLIIGRLAIRSIQRFLIQKYRLGIHKVALIWGNNSGTQLYNILTQNPNLGYEVIYTNDTIDEKALTELAKNKHIDEVILTNPQMGLSEQAQLNDICDEYKLDFQYRPHLFETYGKVDVKTLEGFILFRVKRTTLEGWGHVQKRLFDIIFASLFIIIFSPVFILTALAVKLTSKGSIFYKSQRVGTQNAVFQMYKFRSMYTELCTDESDPQSLAYEQELMKTQGMREGPVYKIHNDPRITPLGKWIRATSLDEFPQFFNVLKGDMSIVGPRPHQPREVAKYTRHQKKVLTVKPGITGMSQVHGRSDLDFDDEVLYDTFYIENWSLILDLIIIIKTPWAMVAPRNAH